MIKVRAFQSLTSQINQARIVGARFASSKNDLIGNAGKPTMDQVGRSVRLYLERADKHNQYMKEQIHDFEVGKRHLANIMGINPDEITQEEINKAINYLLPSGLFSRYARPVLKHPTEILPKFKEAEFDINGKPYSSFFFTCRKNFSEKLHIIATKVVEIKKHEDKQIAKGIKVDPSKQLNLSVSQWKDKSSMEIFLKENLFDPEYKLLVSALENMIGLPYAYLEQDFIFQFRTQLVQQSAVFQLKRNTKQVDEQGRSFVPSEGKRKLARAQIKLYENGTGNVTINGDPFLLYFPELADREQVLFPMHLVDMLLKVDIIATVEGGGHCGQAGAIRHAVAKALVELVSEKDADNLRLAGLLKSDPRNLERMKPGQPGARRKPTWKKR